MSQYAPTSESSDEGKIYVLVKNTSKTATWRSYLKVSILILVVGTASYFAGKLDRHHKDAGLLGTKVFLPYSVPLRA